MANECSLENPVWRTLILKPSELIPAPTELGRTFIDMFVDRLVDSKVLPELLTSGVTKPYLADLLHRVPNDAVKLLIKPALIDIGQHLSQEVVASELGLSIQPSARLLLVVDQLEELFNTSTIVDTDCDAFLALLEALAKSRDVWVLATVRSDFYQKTQKKPALMRMKGHDGLIDVLLPDAYALRRILEEPAHLAEFSFQKDEKSNESLSDKILQDAASHAELLPLVEYVLWQLYSKAKERGQNELRFDDYKSPNDPDDYNGVETALKKKAEEVFNALYDNPIPDERVCTSLDDTEHVFDVVFKSLVTINEDPTTNKELIVRRYSPLESTFPDNSNERKMVDAFVTARLFTTSKAEETGEAIVAVAHESLLRVWPRAEKWVEDHRDLLRILSRMDVRINEGASFLESGPLLSSAKEIYSKNPTDFNGQQCKLIEDSIRHHKRRKLTMYGVMLSAVLIVFGGIFYYTYSGKKVAHAGQLFAEAELYLFKKRLCPCRNYDSQITYFSG